jgi:murein hydrolase activator
MGPFRTGSLVAALLAMLVCASFGRAQGSGLAEQQSRLRSANAASDAAQARSRALERQAQGETDLALQASAQEAAAAERIKAAQADLDAAHARIAIVDRLLAAQRQGVAERQAPIVRLVAALQSMARRPPVLALVQPGSTEDMVHVRAVLGTSLPIVAARTAQVRAELVRTRRLREGAQAAAASLAQSRARLEAERLGLVQLEAEHRLRSRALQGHALVESDRAIALGEQARDIADQMESAGAAAEIQARLAALPGPLPRPEPSDAPTPSSTAPYRLPVAGQLVTGFGEVSDSGVRARGVTFACAASAPVVAPAAGRIVYAGPFRGYRGVVIIDHGGGWTSLVAGLGGIAVRVGDTVATGRLVGRAWNRDQPRLTVELRRRGQPMDLMQLLN